MPFSGASLQNQLRIGLLTNDPVFVYFVGVKFSMGRWRDVLGALAWRKSVFFPGANHPVIDLESSWIHFDLSVSLRTKRERGSCGG